LPTLKIKALAKAVIAELNDDRVRYQEIKSGDSEAIGGAFSTSR
jgi:hypothetical protein